MADLQKVTLKNVSGGPKVVNSVPIVTLQHDEKASVEMTAAELSVIKENGWYEIGDGEDAPVSLAGKNKAQLLEIAKDEGVDVADDATNAQIVDAIEAKRAE